MARRNPEHPTSMPTSTQQSPIEINPKTAIPVHFPEGHLDVDYAEAGAVTGTFDSDNFAVDASYGLYTHFGGDTYRLAKIHFHVHREHLIKGGDPASMELHFVHVRLDDHGKELTDRLVIAALFNRTSGRGPRPREGFRSVNKHFEAAKKSRKMAANSRDRQPLLPTRLKITNLADLVPDNRNGWYTYEGSLTSYPYTEDVTWVVIPHVELVANADVCELYAAHVNQEARRPQELNRRFVLHDVTEAAAPSQKRRR